MKRHPKLIAATLLLLAATPMLASADYGHNRGHISDRLERQSTRIREGTQTGALTRHERRVLREEHREIRRRVERMRDDHGLNKKERRKINKRLDKASRHIRKLKHNDVRRDRRYAHHHYDYRDDYRNDYGDGRSRFWLGYYGWR